MKDGYLTVEEAVTEIRGAMAEDEGKERSENRRYHFEPAKQPE